MTNRTFTRDEAKAADKDLYDAMMHTARMDARLTSAINSLHRVVGDGYRRQYDSRSGWKMTDGEAFDKAQAMVDTDETYAGKDAQRVLETLRGAQDDVIAAQEAEKVADKWAENGRWSRYGVVPGGHIHTQRGCFTLKATTDFRWAHPVSGDTVADAIEVYGEALCSHCFPEAPVAQTTGKVAVDAEGNPMTKAEVAAVAAAKAAKAAAKNAQAVLDGAGKVMFKTERGATNAIASGLDSAIWYGPSHPSFNEWIAQINKVIEALAIKRGVEFDALKAELVAKAEKKAKKALAA